jgi:hypothetical protein
VHAADGCGAPLLNQNATHCQAAPDATLAVIAKLVGSDTATALGISVKSSSPILLLCRRLVDAGHDPATPLHAYRDDTLALTVRSIGEAAALEINAYGTGFRPRRGADAGLPIAANAPARAGHRARRKAA